MRNYLMLLLVFRSTPRAVFKLLESLVFCLLVAHYTHHFFLLSLPLYICLLSRFDSVTNGTQTMFAFESFYHGVLGVLKPSIVCFNRIEIIIIIIIIKWANKKTSVKHTVRIEYEQEHNILVASAISIHRWNLMMCSNND